MLNLKENLTDAAIKLSKTLLESPIQQIFNFDIGFFFISSTVKISDKTWVGWDDGLKPFIIGIVKCFWNYSIFLSSSVLNMNPSPYVDKILAVSANVSPPCPRWSSLDLSVNVPPPSCLMAR